MKKSKENSLEIVDIREVLKKLWKKWYIIIGACILIMGLVFIYNHNLSKKYQAKVSIRVGKFGGRVIEQYNSLYSVIAFKWNKNNVEILNTLDGNKFQGHKIVYSDMVLVITITDESPQKALQTIESIAAYIIKRHDDFYSEANNNFKKIILTEAHKKLLAQYLLPSENFKTSVVQKPEASNKPLNKRLVPKMVKTFLFSLLLGCLLVYLIETALPSLLKNRKTKKK